MNGLKIKTLREPKLIYPAQLTEKKFIGELKGYFVKDSNTYNVLPLDQEAHIDKNRIYPIGFIFPVNPFNYTDKSIASKITYLNNVELSPEDIIKKIQMEIQENAEATTSGEENPEINAFDFEKNFRNELLKEELFRQYNTDIDNPNSSVDPTEWYQFSGAETWIENVFVPLTYDNNEKDCDSNSAIEHNLIGYWEKDELRFIQLSELNECKQELYSLKLDVFSRNTGILESDIMLEKGALFIGCGSVGSLFALELAKSGVGRFLLVDNDTFGYHNICRHQCGIYDVGRYKTAALKERILEINPYAHVVTKNMTIQDVPVPELVEFCDKNTIVIGGADNREGDLYANNFAKQIEMPFMSIGFWERAFAGEVFYCLPKGMPDYQDFMEVSGLLSARVNQNRRFYTTEEDLAKATFEPGISADINFVTNIGVKLALDLLNIGNEKYTQRLLPHLTQYTLICNTNNPALGGERAEIFSYPLQVTTSIVVPYANKK
jgi:molybdopterin/thiamine biosynthesis adenylyltransferase